MKNKRMGNDEVGLGDGRRGMMEHG